MNIYELADLMDKELIIRRYSNQKNRFIARFEHCELKEGAILRGAYGTGTTPISALNSYAKEAEKE